MQLLRSYLKMVAYILKSDYRYNKFNLLLDYTNLIISSIQYHKFSRKKGLNVPIAKVAGNAFEFFSYPQAISLFEEIFIAQQYKFSIEPGQNPHIIDCGSNIGLSIIYFHLTFPGTPIVAFEPDKDAFRLLEKNIRRNNITNATLHNVALSDDDTAVQLFANKNESFLNMSLFPRGNQPHFSETVPAKKLSDFINSNHTFVKIDTEGAEYAIIKDLIQSDTVKYVSQMIVECHYAGASMTPDMLIDDLESKLFTCNHCRHPLFDNATETMVYATRKAR